MFIQGDLTGDEYKTEKLQGQAALSRLQPVTGPSLIDTGKLVPDFSRLWGLANLEKKKVLRAALEAAYIEKSAVTYRQTTPIILQLDLSVRRSRRASNPHAFTTYFH